MIKSTSDATAKKLITQKEKMEGTKTSSTIASEATETICLFSFHTILLIDLSLKTVYTSPTMLQIRTNIFFPAGIILSTTIITTSTNTISSWKKKTNLRTHIMQAIKAQTAMQVGAGKVWYLSTVELTCIRFNRSTLSRSRLVS